MSLISQNKEFLIFIKSLTPAKKNKVLKWATKEQINTISEIVLNFLKRRLTAEEKVIEKLSSFRNKLRKLALKKTPLKEKVKILTTKAGSKALDILLSLVSSRIE